MFIGDHAPRGACPALARLFIAALLVALVAPASSVAAASQPTRDIRSAATERTVIVAANVPSIYGTGIGTDSKANMPVGPWPMIAHAFKASTSSALTHIRFSQRGGPIYSKGTGGTMRISVRPDDGGHPAATMLASLTFKPGNPSGGWTTYKRYGFATPANLTAGRKYYIVFQNLDPSPRSNYISINNIAVLSNVTKPRQPAFGDSDFAVLSTARGPWALEPAYTAVMDLTYANGKHDGQGYIEAMQAKYGVISGSTKRVRETFVLAGTSRNVTKAAVRVRRIAGGSPLILTLAYGNGTKIESVSIPASVIPQSAQSLVGGEVWVTVNFLKTHTLSHGARYTLTLSTASGTTYTTIPIREGTDSGDYGGVGNPTGFRSRRFTDGEAQRTTDGTHWAKMYEWSPVDLQFYLR